MSATVADQWTPWRISGLAALGSLVLLLLLFRPEAMAAVSVWQQSTAFGHCFLVLPIATWLAWERRYVLAGQYPQPQPLLALLVLPCTTVWLLAEQVGVMEGRQLAILGIVWALALAIFGFRVCRAMAAPLLYLIFLVPFGAFLTPALQDFTAAFINAGLNVLAIPHYVDRFIIDIPEGRFQVAEACAGLRFLIAAVAFGTLYALVIYRSPWRRTLFVVTSIVVPIVANGVRALGIVLLGHLRGSAEAGAVDHVLYGWLFFSLVIAGLTVAGLPFQQEGVGASFHGRERPVPGRRMLLEPRHLIAAAGCVLVFASFGPTIAAVVGRGIPAPVAVDVTGVEAPATCQPGRGPGSWHCGDAEITLRVKRFAGRTSPGVLHTALQQTETGAIDSEDVTQSVIDTKYGRWQLSEVTKPAVVIAKAIWRDGQVRSDGLGDRLANAKTQLSGAGTSAMLVTIVAQGPGGEPLAEEFALRVGNALATMNAAGG